MPKKQNLNGIKSRRGKNVHAACTPVPSLQAVSAPSRLARDLQTQSHPPVQVWVFGYMCGCVYTFKRVCTFHTNGDKPEVALCNLSFFIQCILGVSPAAHRELTWFNACARRMLSCIFE